jgi:dipeptidyl aminopeptidase/acylaminoacyl peptidase
MKSSLKNEGQYKILTSLAAASMPKGAVNPLFSPDGTLLRYEEGSDTCVWDIKKKQLVGRFQGRQAVWSPDSEHLAFKYDSQIYVATRDGSSARPFGHGTDPRWHPGGTILYWFKKMDQQTQLLRANAGVMTAPEQIAQISSEGSWTLSPDGHWLAYIHMEPNPTRITGLPDSIVQVGSFPRCLEVRVINLVNGRSFVGEKLPSGAEVISLAWSPKGQTLAYAWELLFDSHGPFQRQIYLWQPSEGRSVVVDVGESVSTSRLSWSPDGSRLALLANPWGHFTTDPFGWLTVFDINKRIICWQCCDFVATATPIWSPNSRMLYCRLASHIEQPYVAISEEGQLLCNLTPTGRYCSGAALSPDGTQIAVSARSFSGINEFWLCPTRDGAPTCITSASQILDDLALFRVWTHKWVTPDGLTLDGIVIEPEEESSLEAPLLLFPAIGERGWDICCLEENLGFLLHWMAQRGYRVFIPSHRRTGLVGLQYLADQWQLTGAAADIVAGVHSLQERLETKKAPIVAFGQSDGGDLICEILVSYPDLLAAAVVSGIQPDFATCYSIEATPNPIMRETFGGPPWERPQEYLDASPIRRVTNVHAPILILMGSRDTSCPNAERFYVALSEAGRDVTYLQFQDQAHWPEAPKQVAAYVEIGIRWLAEKVPSSLKEKLIPTNYHQF